MLNFVKTEFLKLKRSKLVYIVLLGLFAPGLLMFLGMVFGNVGTHPIESFLKDTNLYGLMMFNVIVYVLLGAYMIVMEYDDHTLKSVLTVPISKTNFVLGKTAVFIMLVGLFTVVNYLFMIVLGCIGGCTDITLNVLGNCFIEYLGGNLLLGITLTPFIFLAMLFKNIVPIVIGGIIISLSNMLISATTYAPLSPFNSPLLVVTNELSQYSYGTATPLMIIVVTAIVGLLLGLVYFNNTDAYL